MAFMAALGVMTAVAVAPVLFQIVIFLLKGAFILAIIVAVLWVLRQVTRRTDEQ